MVKKKHTTDVPVASMKLTVGTGYLLFILLIASVIMSSFWPLMALARPEADHSFFISILLAWTLGALLPSIVAYYIGSHDTYRKNKLLHHYNGVLFALATYWLANTVGLLLSTLGIHGTTGVWGPLLVTLLPALVAVVIMMILGVFYAKQHSHQRTLLSYRPFQVVVAVTLVMVIISPLVLMATGGGESPVPNWFIAVGVQAAFMLAFILIAYRVLKGQVSRSARWTHASLILAMLIIFSQSFMTVFSEIIPAYYMTQTVILAAAAVIFYVCYLVLQYRALRKG